MKKILMPFFLVIYINNLFSSDVSNQKINSESSDKAIDENFKIFQSMQEEDVKLHANQLHSILFINIPVNKKISCLKLLDEELNILKSLIPIINVNKIIVDAKIAGNLLQFLTRFIYYSKKMFNETPSFYGFEYELVRLMHEKIIEFIYYLIDNGADIFLKDNFYTSLEYIQKYDEIGMTKISLNLIKLYEANVENIKRIFLPKLLNEIKVFPSEIDKIIISYY